MPSYTENGVTYTFQVISNGNLAGNARITGTNAGTSLTGEISIPSAVNNMSQSGSWITVVEVASNAFMNISGLTAVIIPESVIVIAIAAFSGTPNLKSVIFNSTNLLTIGESAFSMSGLTKLIVPSSVTSIGEYAFKGTQDLTTITILSPNVIINGTTTTGAFYESGLRAVYHNPRMYIDTSLHTEPWSISDFFGATNNGESINMVPLDEPIMTITASEVLPGATSNETMLHMSFVSSEPTFNFTDTDIIVTNGIINDFSPVVYDTFGHIDISGSFIEASTIYTATFTPQGDGECSVNVPIDTFTTIEGIINPTGATLSWIHDITAPVITISSYEIANGDGSIYSNESTINLVFTLSESASDFTWEDIDVNNGVLGTLTPSLNDSDNGKVYTATFSPIATNMSCTINVSSDKFTDAVGNHNTAAQQFSWIYDNTTPSMTITALELSTGNGTLYSNDTVIHFTFTSNEVIENFTVDDIIVTNGTIGQLVTVSDGDDTGKIYTATFIPSITDTLCSIKVSNSTFNDLAGNANNIISQFSWTHDVTPPVITITASEISLGDGTLFSNSSSVILTFTSTKITSDFEVQDIIVTNGSIGQFAMVSAGVDTGKVYTAVFTSSVTYGLCSVNIGSGFFVDELGNPNIGSEQFAWTHDVIKPSMLITSSEISSGDGTIQSNTPVVTLTFVTNKQHTTFTQSDIVVINGVLGDLSMVSAGDATGKVYTASFTPTLTDATCRIDVLADSFVDNLGNANTAAHSFYWLYDVTAPTMIITASEIPIGDGTFSSNALSVHLTFTSSEVTSSFTKEDITVTNGIIGLLTESSSENSIGKVYSATFIPFSTDTLCTVNVLADRFTDVPGNTNTGANEFSWIYDITAPSIIISALEIPLGDGSIYSNVPIINLIFTSNEVISDFSWNDISVTNGILGELHPVTSGDNSGKVYSATFTPFETDTLCSIQVNANKFIDTADNFNTGSEQFSWVFDITVPTMVITSPDIIDGNGTIYSNVSNVSLIFTASEIITNFVRENIIVTNGVLGDLIMVSSENGSGRIYTADFSPTTTDMPCTINIPADMFSDLPGNKNSTVQQFSWIYDVTAPSMVIGSTEISVGDGTVISNDPVINLTFTSSEPITDFVREDIVVVNGVLGTLIDVSTSGNVGYIYTSTFTPSVLHGLCSINVSAERFSDIPGNLNTGSIQFSWIHDVIPVTISISSTTIALGDSTIYSNASNVELIFTTNKINTNLVEDDIILTNGVIGQLTLISTSLDIGDIYSCIFTPSITDTLCSVNVPAGVFSDLPGNVNTPTEGFSWTYDVTRPTAFITYSYPAPYKSGDIVILTATISEFMNPTLIPKIAISGGGTVVDNIIAPMISIPSDQWISASNPEYMYSYLVPEGDGFGEISLSEGEDLAGNTIYATPTSGSVFTIDNTPPIATITYDLAWPYKGGNVVTFTATINKPMRMLPLPKITITGDGIETTVVDMTRAPYSSPSSLNPVYTYVYSVPSSGDGTGTISLSVGRDLAGNEIVSEPIVPVVFLVDNTNPTLIYYMSVSSNSVNTRAKVGDVITTTFKSSEEIIPVGIILKSNMDGELVVGSGESTSIVATDNENEWRSMYTVNIDDEIGPIQITLMYMDVVGNYSETVYSHFIIIDIVAPEIILLGDKTVYISRWEDYIDAGATAYDTIDDVGLTDSITTTSNVDSSIPGTYSVTYDVLDIAGNAAIQVVRTVIVTGFMFGGVNISVPSPICFPLGTLVSCDQGDVCIESLIAGVHTFGGVGMLSLSCSDPYPWVRVLVHVCAGSFGVGVPARDFRVSPAHRVRYGGDLLSAECLVGVVPGVSLVPFSGGPLFNVLLREHVCMTVCGVECDTLDPRNLVSQIVGGAYSPRARDARLRSMSRAVRRNDARAYVGLCAAVSAACRAHAKRVGVRDARVRVRNFL